MLNFECEIVSDKKDEKAHNKKKRNKIKNISKAGGGKSDVDFYCWPLDNWGVPVCECVYSHWTWTSPKRQFINDSDTQFYFPSCQLNFVMIER